MSLFRSPDVSNHKYPIIEAMVLPRIDRTQLSTVSASTRQPQRQPTAANNDVRDIIGSSSLWWAFRNDNCRVFRTGCLLGIDPYNMWCGILPCQNVDNMTRSGHLITGRLPDRDPQITVRPPWPLAVFRTSRHVPPPRLGPPRIAPDPALPDARCVPIRVRRVGPCRSLQ